MDMQKAQRETLRWDVLRCLSVAGYVGCSERVVYQTCVELHGWLTPEKLRNEVDYLRDRKLVVIGNESTEQWHLTISHHGRDVVEYTVDCHPGIARPPRSLGL